MLIRAVHPVASVCKLAHNLWVKIHTFVAECAFGEELALFGRVLVGALILPLFAVGEVPASDLLRVLRRLTGLLVRFPAVFA